MPRFRSRLRRERRRRRRMSSNKTIVVSIDKSGIIKINQERSRDCGTWATGFRTSSRPVTTAPCSSTPIPICSYKDVVERH